MLLHAVLAIPGVTPQIITPHNALIYNSTSSWPELSEINDFKATLQGNLIKVIPWINVCKHPNLNLWECFKVGLNFENAHVRADTPGALQYIPFESDAPASLRDNSQSCTDRSDANSPCYQGNLPRYYVNVTSALDIQNTIKFAQKHSLRLSIRNTGHDLQSRSTARDSIGIWTHWLKGIEFGTFNKCDSRGVASVTIQAGETWYYKLIAGNRFIMQ
jgi:hypothetical protein